MEQKGGPPSLFVVESSRTIQERALEHHDAARKKDETSHMYRHQRLVLGAEEPRFIFKVVSNHRSALNRQIKEAVSRQDQEERGSTRNSEFKSRI